MSPSTLDKMDLFQLPKEKTVLWDHTGCGRSYTLHMVAHQKPNVYIKEKVLQLASKHLESSPNGLAFCFLSGSMTTNGPSSVGLSVVFNKFDDNFISSHEDEFVVPVAITKKTKGDYQWSFEEYFSDLKAIAASTSNMSSLDLSQLVKLRISCSNYGIQCDVKVELATVATAFTATPICSVPILRTELSEYLSKSNDFVPHTGFLVMDAKKRLIVIQETEQDLSSLPFVGIWVSGISSILHTVVWAACVRYVSCILYEKRLCMPPLPFLLVLYHPETVQPTFYDCITEGDYVWPVFASFEGQASSSLPKVPVQNTKMLLVELMPVIDKSKELDDAIRNIERREFSRSSALITSNTCDVPQPAKRAPKIFEIHVDPEPQMSFYSDSGSIFNSSPKSQIPSPQHSNMLSSKTEPSTTATMQMLSRNQLVSNLPDNFHHKINNSASKEQSFQSRNSAIPDSSNCISVSPSLHSQFDYKSLGNCGYKGAEFMHNTIANYSNGLPNIELENYMLPINNTTEFLRGGLINPDFRNSSAKFFHVPNTLSDQMALSSMNNNRTAQYRNGQNCAKHVPDFANHIACTEPETLPGEDDLPEDVPRQFVTPRKSLIQLDQQQNTKYTSAPSVQREIISHENPAAKIAVLPEMKTVPMKSCLKKTNATKAEGQSNHIEQVPATKKLVRAKNNVPMNSKENIPKNSKMNVMKKANENFLKSREKSVNGAVKKSVTGIPIKTNSNLLNKNKVSDDNNIITMINNIEETLNVLKDKHLQLTEEKNQPSTKPKININRASHQNKVGKKSVPQRKQSQDTKGKTVNSPPEKKAVPDVNDTINDEEVMLMIQQKRDELCALENRLKELSLKKADNTASPEVIEKDINNPEVILENANPDQQIHEVMASTESPEEILLRNRDDVVKKSCTAATMTSFASVKVTPRAHNSPSFRYDSHQHRRSMSRRAHRRGPQFHSRVKRINESSISVVKEQYSYDVDMDTDAGYSVCLEHQAQVDMEEPGSPEQTIFLHLPNIPDRDCHEEESCFSTWRPQQDCSDDEELDNPNYGVSCLIFQDQITNIIRRPSAANEQHQSSNEEWMFHNEAYDRHNPHNREILQQQNIYSQRRHVREMKQINKRHIRTRGREHISVMQESCTITRHDQHRSNCNCCEVPIRFPHTDETTDNSLHRRKQSPLRPRQKYQSEFANYGLTGNDMSCSIMQYFEHYGLKDGNDQSNREYDVGDYNYGDSD